MNDFLKFLTNTRGFAGVVFEGYHQSFSIEFIDECYKQYQRKGINYLEKAQYVLTAAWMYDEPGTILTNQEITRVAIACNEDFIQKWLAPEIIAKCQKVVERTHQWIIKRESYLYRKNEARNLLANKTFREKILNEYNHKCNYCGTTENLSIDHKISLFAGGSNNEENFQVLCISCNSKKGIGVDKTK